MSVSETKWLKALINTVSSAHTRGITDLERRGGLAHGFALKIENVSIVRCGLLTVDVQLIALLCTPSHTGHLAAVLASI